MNEQEQIELLEALVIDNPQLDELESLISEFNIFEAMGAVRQELRHSDFLAFLLNPSEKHGLDDKFLKRFLIKLLSSADESPISPIAVNLTDFSKAVVERETQNIDILISDADSGIVCLIENKIFSSEHSNQLARYLAIVKRRFPKFKTIIPVFLTPDGISPEDDNSPYIPFSYEEISEIIEHVRQTQESMIGVDVNTMMHHYIAMLRRHVVSNSAIAELCRQIYQAHKPAFDLIVEHMPDIRQEISEYLVQLVESTPNISKVRYSKSYVDCMVNQWEEVPSLNVGTGWANSEATVSIEFSNADSKLSLYLIVGPVQQGYQHIREAIFKQARTNPNVFRNCRSKLSKQWTVLYRMDILRQSDYEDASSEDLIPIIDEKWQYFLQEILPMIHEHLMTIEFENTIE